MHDETGDSAMTREWQPNRNSLSVSFLEKDLMHSGRQRFRRQPASETPPAHSKRHDPLTDSGNQSLDIHA
jgi:hypothetical protein